MAAMRTIDAGGRRFVVRGRLLRTAQLAGDGFEFLDDPDAAARALRSRRSRVDLLTFGMRVRDAAVRYGYHFDAETVAALPVTTYEAWWTQIDSRARNHVRAAAKKGVVVREVRFTDALVEGISRVYNESPVRQGRPFTHYGKDVATVRAENGTFLDRAVFIGAFFAEELVGFTKLVLDEHGTQAGTMQIVAMIRHRDKSATNALMAQAVRSCAERGVQCLVYSTFGIADRHGYGLNEFKLANGFRPIAVPRYYVPLTALGRLVLAARLHRLPVQHIPAPIAARLKALRGRWSTSPLARRRMPRAS